jgi:FKBP-type peptidyl-prolyl cis-trans isomerase
MNFRVKTILAVTFAAAALPLASSAGESPATETDTLTNKVEKVSYSVGMSIALSLKRSGYEVDADVITAALKDVLAGRPTKLTDQAAQKTLMEYQQELQAKREEARLQMAENNRKAGEVFLAANKGKAGIKTQGITLSGTNTAELQYRTLNEGSGESPKSGDTVVVNVRGKTTSGAEFDNRNNFRAALSQMQRERGLSEAVKMMKPGAKWEIFLPSILAFGDFGGPNVEPGAAVIYEVELVSVETPQPLTSDIIKVPSAEELKKGAKIEVIKAEDLKKMQTNTPPNRP